MLDDDIATSVNAVSADLEKKGYELVGIKGDGNCYCRAFLASYKSSSSLKIPVLDGEEDQLSFLRNKIADLYEKKREKLTADDRKRLEEIRKDGTWLSAHGEGNALAWDLQVPIRTVTVNPSKDKDGDPIIIDDMLTFPERK